MFEVYWDGVLVGFDSILNMPSGSFKYGFREHRLVVLPDFQGLGFGTKISDFIGNHLISKGYKFFSRTTHLRLGNYRNKSPLWRATGSNQILQKSQVEKQKTRNQGKKYKNLDGNRIAYSHEFVGEDYTNLEHQVIVCVGDCSYEEAEKFLDFMIDKTKFTELVCGIANQSEVTIWEKVALSKGIRTNVLSIKSNNEFSLNKTYLTKKFDAITINLKDRDVIREYADNINSYIGCFKKNTKKFYKCDIKTKTIIELD